MGHHRELHFWVDLPVFDTGSGWMLYRFPVCFSKISFTWMERTKDKSLQRVFERPKKHVVSKNWGFDLYKYTIGIQTTNPRHQANQALDTPTIKPLDFWNWIRDDGLGIGFQYGYVAFFIYKETRIGNRPEHVSVEKNGWWVGESVTYIGHGLATQLSHPLAHWESHLSPPHPVGSKRGDRGSHRRSVRQAPGSLREFLGWKIAQGSRTWCLYGWYRFPKVMHLISMVAIQQALS